MENPNHELICEGCGRFESQCVCSNKLEELGLLLKSKVGGVNKMTEQEFIEKIANDFKAMFWKAREFRLGGSIDIEALVLEYANHILALIKEALPELAKEADYVKLAKDQSLPSSGLVVLLDPEPFERGFRLAEERMLEVVDGEAFRKVEVKDGS